MPEGGNGVAYANSVSTIICENPPHPCHPRPIVRRASRQFLIPN
jgi:hypothetical protein